MTCWDMLNIAPTFDQRKIKGAYAKLLQKYHPEEDPAGFQKLRSAFEEAFEKSKNMDCGPSRCASDAQQARETGTENAPGRIIQCADPSLTRPENPAELTDDEAFYAGAPETLAPERMAAIESLYADFSKRIDMARWQAIFADLRRWPVDARLQLGFSLFGFLAQNPWVPPLVWALGQELFDWNGVQADLCKRYGENMVDAVFWRIRNYRWLPDFDSIPVSAGVDYDTYLYHRERGADAIIQGDLAKAEEHLTRGSALLQGDCRLQRLAVHCSRMAGDQQAALTACEALLRGHPGDLDGRLQHAALLLAAGSVSPALSAFQAVLGIAPEHPAGLIGLARCHIALGNLFEAQKLLEAALDQCPDHIEAHMEMLRVCHRLIEKYVRQLEKQSLSPNLLLQIAEACLGAGLCREADKMIADNIGKLPDSGVYLVWARICNHLEQPEKALALFDQAQQVAEKNGENYYNILIHKGIFNCHRKAFQQAIVDLEQARDMSQPVIDARVWRYLADAYYQTDAFDASIEHYNALIDADDSEPSYYFDRGCAYFSKQEYTSALGDFQTVLQREYYSFARLWIAKCFVEMKQYEPALEALDAAKDFEPVCGENFYYSARCAFECGDAEGARGQIDQSLALDPEDVAAQRLAGYIYDALGDESRALDCFRMYLRQPDASPMNGIWAGYYCIAKNKIAEAVKYLEPILEVEEDPWIMLGLADILCTLGKTKRALAYIERYFAAMEKSTEAIDDIAFYLRGKLMLVRYWNQPRKSLPDLHRACELEACDMAFYFLSLAYFDLRDLPNSEKFARAARDRDPNNPDFCNLVEGIERFRGFGRLRQKLVNANAMEIWKPTQPEPWYAVGDFTDLGY
jgi:tetratricopeptide (TPR) repeat protein